MTLSLYVPARLRIFCWSRHRNFISRKVVVVVSVVVDYGVVVDVVELL